MDVARLPTTPYMCPMCAVTEEPLRSEYKRIKEKTVRKSACIDIIPIHGRRHLSKKQQSVLVEAKFFFFQATVSNVFLGSKLWFIAKSKMRVKCKGFLLFLFFDSSKFTCYFFFFFQSKNNFSETRIIVEFQVCNSDYFFFFFFISNTTI